MKKIIILTLSLIAFLNFNLIFAAGKWENDAIGTKYALDNGSYYTSGWYWIDSDDDGVSECYLFDENGYIYKDFVTSDNLFLNHLGQLTIQGMLQQKIVEDSVNKKNNEYNDASKNVDELTDKFIKSSTELLYDFTSETRDLNKFDKNRLYKKYETKLNELYSGISTKKSAEILKHKISYEESKKWEEELKEKYEDAKKKLKILAGVK